MILRLVILRALALFAAGAVLCTGCSDEDSVEDAAPAQRDEAAPTLKELADAVGCPAEEMPEGQLPGVMQRAASDGLRCSFDDDIIDTYQRAPVTGSEGGTVENIDLVLSTGTIEEGCDGWVLTGTTWFIFSSNEAVLRGAEDALNSVVRPVLPAMPSYSYPVPGVNPACGT